MIWINKQSRRENPAKRASQQDPCATCPPRGDTHDSGMQVTCRAGWSSGVVAPYPTQLTRRRHLSTNIHLRLLIVAANVLVSPAQIQSRIHVVRGRRVMLDADLARCYGAGTRDLNKAVGRNLDRFPQNFAFMLTLAETRALMFQPGTSKSGRGGVRKPARAFTEQGVAMLASVLRSTRAVAVSIAIVRAFVHMREVLATHWRYRELTTPTLPAALGAIVPSHLSRPAGARSTPAKPPAPNQPEMEHRWLLNPGEPPLQAGSRIPRDPPTPSPHSATTSTARSAPAQPRGARRSPEWSASAVRRPPNRRTVASALPASGVCRPTRQSVRARRYDSALHPAFRFGFPLGRVFPPSAQSRSASPEVA